MTNWLALAFCISLANLFHLLRWYEILGRPPFQQSDESFTTIGLLLIVTSIVVMSGLSFAAFVLARRFPVLGLLIRLVCFVVLSVSVLIALGILDPDGGANSSSPTRLMVGVVVFKEGDCSLAGGISGRD